MWSLGTSGSCVRHATDCATRPGSYGTGKMWYTFYLFNYKTGFSISKSTEDISQPILCSSSID